MSTSLPSPGSVYHGIDFSGSREHRKKTWVSTLTAEGSAETRRGFSYRTLAAFMLRTAEDGRRHFWLVDAPLALPAELLAAHAVAPTWLATLEWLATFGKPQEWRRACRRVSRREVRREADRRARTPLAPTNLRMFKQTWFAMVSVLAPLLKDPRAVVLPMEAAAPGKELDQAVVLVGEGCPSSMLQDRGWPHRGYKGPAEKNRSLRRELVARLTAEAGIAVADGAVAAAVDDTEGDALDSLLLLPSVHRFAGADQNAILTEDPAAHVEGWVYV